MSVIDMSQVNSPEELKHAGKRDYVAFKQELDREMYQAADSFVRIGYLLKEARDTGILEGSGYATMSEFAKVEYGLSPDQTSRFISVYERFGDGEGHLKSEYSEHGQTKLIEMLSLPEAVAESIPPELPREEIRQIKQEVKEEQQATPIERMIEETDIPENLNDLEAFLFVHLKSPDIFRKYWESMKTISAVDIENLLKMFEPSGIAVITERLPRRGRIMLSFNGTNNKPAIVDVRQDTRTEFEWADLHEALSWRLYPGEMISDTPEEDYEKTYGHMEEPKKEDAEPEQVKKEPESKSQTNFEPESEEAQQVKQEEKPKECKVSQVLEKSDIKEEEAEKPTNFEGMNLPEEQTDPEVIGELTYYDRVTRAAKDLNEELNLFMQNVEPGLIASEIQDQMDRVEEKHATWRNLMIEWRKNRE